MKIIGALIFLLLMRVEGRFLSLVTGLFVKEMSATKSATKV